MPSHLQETALALDPQLSPDQVLAAVTARFSTRRRPLGPLRETWYDTFDGRVRRAGGALRSYRVNGSTRLDWRGQLRPAGREVQLASAPGLVRELPPGPVRDELAPVLEMRRLLPQVDVELRGVALDVLDGERKTVARLRLEQSRARPAGQGAWSPLPTIARAVPLRGYERDFQALLDALAKLGGLHPGHLDQPDLAFAVTGIEPPRDASKLAIPLERGLRADEGLRRIHRALLEVVLANEPGVRADLDSEFLHDYRVAVRRTRSVLGQIKRVFPDRDVQHFQREFAWLGDATSPTRDMDVFLLQLEDYQRELEGVDLRHLHEFLVERQDYEHRRLVRALTTRRYARLINGWRAFLERPTPTSEPKNAGQPVGTVFSKRIGKLFRRMVVNGALALSPGVSAAKLHRVRLDGKKLRYLLDVSRDVYPAEEVGRAVRELKRIQDVLGDFNDFEVQSTQISALAADMFARGSAEADTLLALGRLTERLRVRGREARGRFAQRYERFASRENRARYRELFGASAGRVR